MSIAEALLEMLSRLSLLREIVTNQGPSFTLELVQEVCQLLSVKFFRTSPYHAIANELVEKFNGTLKTMLRRMCQKSHGHGIGT